MLRRNMLQLWTLLLLLLGTFVSHTSQSTPLASWSALLPLDQFTTFIDPSRPASFDCLTLFSATERTAFALQAAVDENDLRFFWTFDGVIIAAPLFDGVSVPSDRQSTIQLDLETFRPLNASNYASLLSDLVKNVSTNSSDRLDDVLNALANMNVLMAPLDRVVRAARTNVSSWLPSMASRSAPTGVRSQLVGSPFRAQSPEMTSALPPAAASASLAQQDLVQALWTSLNLSALAIGPAKLDIDRALLGATRQPFAGVLRCGLFASSANQLPDDLVLLSRPVFVQPAYLDSAPLQRDAELLEVISGGTALLTCVLPANSRPPLRFVRWERSVDDEQANFTEVQLDILLGDAYPVEWLTPASNGSLLIADVSSELAGAYRCVGVNDALQQERIGRVTLLRITDQTPIPARYYLTNPHALITDNSSQTLQVSEGDRVTLACSMPHVTFTTRTNRCYWTRYSASVSDCSIPNSQVGVPSDQRRHALNGQLMEINNVSRCEVGSLRCQCSINGKLYSPRLSLDFLVRLPPRARFEPTNAAPNGFDIAKVSNESVVVDPSNAFVALSGQTAQFKCAVESTQRTVVWWFRNGVLISADEQTVTDGSAARGTDVNPAQFVAGSETSRSQLARTANLDVLSMRLKSEYSCPTRTRNKVCSELRISNVDVRDAGMYQCVATNEFGISSAFVRLIVRAPAKDSSAVRPAGAGEQQNLRASPSNLGDNADGSSPADLQPKVDEPAPDTPPASIKPTKVTKKRRKVTSPSTTQATTAEKLVLYAFVEKATILSPTSVLVEVSYSIQWSNQLELVDWNDVQSLRAGRRRRSAEASSQPQSNASLPMCAGANPENVPHTPVQVDLDVFERQFQVYAQENYKIQWQLNVRQLTVYLRYTLVDEPSNMRLIEVKLDQQPQFVVTGLETGRNYYFDVLLCDHGSTCYVENQAYAFEATVDCISTDEDSSNSVSEDGAEVRVATIDVDTEPQTSTEPQSSDRSEDEAFESVPSRATGNGGMQRPGGKKSKGNKGSANNRDQQKTRKPKVNTADRDVDRRPVVSDELEQTIEKLHQQVVLGNFRALRINGSSKVFLIWRLQLYSQSADTVARVPRGIDLQYRIRFLSAEEEETSNIIELERNATACVVPPECFAWPSCFVQVFTLFATAGHSERQAWKSSDLVQIVAPNGSGLLSEVSEGELISELQARDASIDDLYDQPVAAEISTRRLPETSAEIFYVVLGVALTIMFLLLLVFIVVCVLKQRRGGARKRAAARAAAKHNTTDTNTNTNGFAADPLCTMQTHKTATLTRLKPHGNGYLLNGLGSDYGQSQLHLAGAPPALQRYSSIPAGIGAGGMAEFARTQAEAQRRLMSPNSSMLAHSQQSIEMNAANGLMRGASAMQPGMGANAQTLPLLQTAVVEQNEDANSVDGEMAYMQGMPNGGIVPVQSGTLQKKALLVTAQHGTQLAAAAYYPSGTPLVARPASSASVRLQQPMQNGNASAFHNANARGAQFIIPPGATQTAEANFGGVPRSGSTHMLAGGPNGLAAQANAMSSQIRVSNASLMRAMSNTSGNQMVTNYDYNAQSQSGTLPRVVNVPQPVHLAQLQHNGGQHQHQHQHQHQQQQQLTAISQPNIAASNQHGLQLASTGQNGSIQVMATAGGTRSGSSAMHLANGGQPMVADGSTSEVSVMSNGSARFRRRKKRSSNRASPANGNDSLTRDQSTSTMQYAHSQSSHSIARSANQNGGSFTMPGQPTYNQVQGQFIVNGAPQNQFVNGADVNNGMMMSPQYFSTPIGHSGAPQTAPAYHNAMKPPIAPNAAPLNTNGQRATHMNSQNGMNAEMAQRYNMMNGGQQMNSMPGGQQAMLQQYVRAQSPGAGLRRDSPGYFMEPPRVHDFADYAVNN